MKKYEHVRLAVVKKRRKGATLSELVEHFGMKKTTIYYWIKDIPAGQPSEAVAAARFAARSAAQIKRSKAAGKVIKANAAKKRQEAYDQAMAEAPELFKVEGFRDFIAMYHGEGTRARRGEVELCNGNPAIVQMAHHWVRSLSNPDREVRYTIRYYRDHDPEQLRIFWGEKLGVSPECFKLFVKLNSEGLATKNQRSKYGVCTVRVNDTYLRSRLQAWMDYMEQQWTLMLDEAADKT